LKVIKEDKMRSPRFTYHDTAKGIMRTDGKTGKKHFIPSHPRSRKKKR
jgi:hypothetical protein